MRQFLCLEVKDFILSRNLFNLEVKKPEPSCRIVTVDGRSKPVPGYVHIPVRLGDHVRVARILVVPDSIQTLILGRDICNLFRLSLNFSDMTWEINSRECFVFN